MSVTVSVVIPTYNRSKLVVQSIESVLQQSYGDLEIIVIDDGSTDDTEQRVAKFGNKVVYERQRNRGVNAARNHGLAIANGRYVALLDDDDLWLQWKIEQQLRLLSIHSDAAFVFSDFYILRNSAEWHAHGLYSWHNNDPAWLSIFSSQYREFFQNGFGTARTSFDVYKGDIYARSLLAPIVLPSTSLIRRDRIDPDLILDEQDSTCGDWAFFATLSKRHGAVFMDIETTLNRSHEDATRLTRLPRSLQLERRLAMTRRIWKADVDFYKEHADSVNDIERRLLLQLAVANALGGNVEEARRLLVDRSKVPGSSALRELVLEQLIRMPAGSWLLQLAKSLRS